MDPFSTTHGEDLIKLIIDNAPTDESIIKQVYEEFDTTKMIEGIDYYHGESEIRKRVIQIYDESGQAVEDKEATNHKKASAWFKILVDQKQAYLSGEPGSFSSKTDSDESVKFLEIIEDVIGEEFEDTLPELIKGASQKGREWLHPYIDENGEFQHMIIPAETFIPLYEPTKKRDLLAGIRFYQYDDETIKLEYWDTEQVTYYEIVDGSLVLDVTEDVNPRAHYNDGRTPRSWGKVPFIEFANNEERMTDLGPVKDSIDAYDLLGSDVMNTLDDMQSVFFVLKGYEGEESAGFLKRLKRYKVLKTSDEPGSGVDTIKVEVPVEAAKMQRNVLKEEIFSFGQGVDPNPEIIGDAPSGVALKNLYSLLDMKASVLERKFSRAIRQFVWFIAEYAKNAGMGEYDPKEIQFKFNKLLLTNEAEVIQMARDSKGVISDETIMANHPWVTDVEIEKERFEQEQLMYGEQLPSLSEGYDDEERNPDGTPNKKKKEVACNNCGGSGKVTSEKTGESIQCPVCKGSGVRSA